MSMYHILNTNTCVYQIGGHKKHTEILSTHYQLFTSHLNLEYDISNVFTKLNITKKLLDSTLWKSTAISMVYQKMSMDHILNSYKYLNV